MTPDAVNPRRTYNSPRRQEQAAATRRQILDAARRLFERQGYAATTMAQVAGEAGVALKTVYLAFDTKSGLLQELWNVTLRGDDGEVPVAEQDWYREMLEEPDPERQLRLNARNSRLGKERVASVGEVIRSGRGRRSGDRRALGAHPGPVPPEPARGRREPRGEEGACPRRRSRRRPALADQPPQHVAVARRRARLDSRRVRAMGGGHSTPRAARWRRRVAAV